MSDPTAAKEIAALWDFIEAELMGAAAAEPTADLRVEGA
jgi:hypothetical protein